jgi:hypothetical protein
MLNLSRPNIKNKLAKGVIHFVEYEFEFEGKTYCLKTEAIKNSHGKNLVEHPYWLRIKA